MTRRTCEWPGCEVSIVIHARRKTLMCRAHANAVTARQPERNAKIAASLRQVFRDPAARQERAAAVSRGMQARLARDPELLAFYQANAAAMGRVWGGRTFMDPDTQRRAIARSRAKRLAHIPVEYRDEYVALERKTSLSAAERTEVILRQVERDTTRFAATGVLPKTGGK